MRESCFRKATRAWGPLGTMPDWVYALADACDNASVRKVAVKLDASPAIISLAINNQRENLEFIKERVENTLMASIVSCPILGVMGKTDCLQEQVKPFLPASPLRSRIYRACRSGCPNFKEAKK